MSKKQKTMEEQGVEPWTSRMRSVHSTTELHPRDIVDVLLNAVEKLSNIKHSLPENSGEGLEQQHHKILFRQLRSSYFFFFTA